MNHLNILFENNSKAINDRIEETNPIQENDKQIVNDLENITLVEVNHQTILNDADNVDADVNVDVIISDVQLKENQLELSPEDYHKAITDHLNNIPTWDKDKIQLFKKISVKDINNVFDTLQDILRIEGNSFSIENFISMRNDKNKIRLTFSENFQNEILNVERKIKIKIKG